MVTIEEWRNACALSLRMGDKPPTYEEYLWIKKEHPQRERMLAGAE